MVSNTQLNTSIIVLYPQFSCCIPLADAGLASAVQAKVLEALHDRRVNTRAVQNAASQRSGGESLYGAQEFLAKVGVSMW